MAFVYDQQSFDLLDTVDHGGIGWGLTNDGQRLIMSDGSSILSFRDPLSFAELAQVQVSDGGEVGYLNELEFVRGEVLANVYLTDMVARINPDSGRVIAWIDLAGILDPVPPGAGVLNGIAWDDMGERLFVTGKEWPTVFEIELVGCPDLPLFFDSFATGNTAAWSATVQ